jgi:D-amino-acid dehydrogenase
VPWRFARSALAAGGDLRKQAVIVCAGIVGLATAYHLHQQRLAMTVIDRDPAGDKTSFGNAGGIGVTEVVPASVPGLAWKVPGWLMNPLGPLAVRPPHAVRLLPWLWRFAKSGSPREVARIATALAALNSRVLEDLLPMLAKTGLTADLHRKGALTVYESHRAYEMDAAEWALKRAHGIEVHPLSGAAARTTEPALGLAVACGVFTPQWAHVSDPRRLVEALRIWLQQQGVVIVQGDATGVSGTALALHDGQRIVGDTLMVAAGAWSGKLAAQLGDAVALESERGSNTTIPEPGVTLGREVILPSTNSWPRR